MSDKYIQCPYDAYHQILPAKIQVHLSRCRRNHKDVPKSVCPFNTTHILNEPELEIHVKNCPDRTTYETNKYRDVKLGNIINPIQANAKDDKINNNDGFVPFVECAENWDEEPDVATYNPATYCESAPIIRNIIGATPSQRREFRNKEQKRHLFLNKPKNN